MHTSYPKPLADPRLAFSADELLDEALIEALADLGTAERAALRATPDVERDAALAEARRVLERTRARLAAQRFPITP